MLKPPSPPSLLLKRLRAYRTIVLGLVIGLVYAILTSDQTGNGSIPPWLHLFEQRILVLTVSGILGGVLYTIMVDGTIELPRFKDETGDQFEAGLLGDVVLGIAGAFILEFLTSPIGVSDAIREAVREQTSFVTYGAKGIIGGYGSKNLMDLALNRLSRRSQWIKARTEALQQDNQALDERRSQLQAHTDDFKTQQFLISRVNHFLLRGGSMAEESELRSHIRTASAELCAQLFTLAQMLRSMTSRTDEFRASTQRTIPIFAALLDNPNAADSHQYHAQLAFAYRDAERPPQASDLRHALTHLHQAIARRPPSLQSTTWTYELNRAVVRMELDRDPATGFVSPPTSRDAILTDLLTVHRLNPLDALLHDAQRFHLDTPIIPWLEQYHAWVADHAQGHALLTALSIATGSSDSPGAGLPSGLLSSESDVRGPENAIAPLPLPLPQPVAIDHSEHRPIPPDVAPAVEPMVPADRLSPAEAVTPDRVTPASPTARPAQRWQTVLLSVGDWVGASVKTAQNGLMPAVRHLVGTAASHKMAEDDWPRVQALWSRFEHAGKKCDLPPSVLAAIASRESRCGRLLDDGWGDGGNAFGIMQIDRRYHTLEGVEEGPDSQTHLNQAADILATMVQQVMAKHPTWEDRYWLQGAVAAYNVGVSNIRTQTGIDRGTTHDDYGADVLARAQFYAKQMNANEAAGRPATALSERLTASLSSEDVGEASDEPVAGAVAYRMEAVKNTWLKASTAPSAQLRPDEKRHCPVGTQYAITQYARADHGHYRVHIPGESRPWYIFDAAQHGLDSHWDTSWENDRDEVESAEIHKVETHGMAAPAAGLPDVSATVRISAVPVATDIGTNDGASDGATSIGAGLTKEMPFATLITPHIRYGELTKYEEARRFVQNYQCKTAYELCLFLERCRTQFGDRPIIITSGHRPPRINAAQRGSRASEHLYDHPEKGAVDFLIKGVSIYDVQAWCDRHYPYSLGYGAKRGFVHLGMRQGRPRVRWHY